MSLASDEFDRLERLIYRPVSTRPDWLKAWRNEAQYLLYLARRAVDVDDEELVQELEEQARDMADVVEAKLRGDGLL
jgi:phage terminase Nu1 subunit (DNA packaging protein)